MDLITIAIAVCWFLIGLIVLCGIVYVAFYVVKQFMTVPPKVEQAVWLIVFLLVLIALLGLVAGHGLHVAFPR